jgi:hypothetical protein
LTSTGNIAEVDPPHDGAGGFIAAVREPSEAEGLQVPALTSRWDLRLDEDGITVDLGIPGTADPKQKASTRHDD